MGRSCPERLGTCRMNGSSQTRLCDGRNIWCNSRGGGRRRGDLSSCHFCCAPAVIFNFAAPFVVPVLERICTRWMYFIGHRCKMLQRGALCERQPLPAAALTRIASWRLCSSRCQTQTKCKTGAVLCNGGSSRVRGPRQVRSRWQSGCCRDCRSAEEQQRPRVHVCRHRARFCPF